MIRCMLTYIISVFFVNICFAQEHTNRRYTEICYIATVQNGSLKKIRSLFIKNNICIYSQGSSFYAIYVDKFNKNRSLILLKSLLKREKINIKIND